jgi:fructose-1,6-bisphosphatase II
MNKNYKICIFIHLEVGSMHFKTNLMNEWIVQGLVMEFLHVAQQAAIASHPWIGKGKKYEADDAGTAAMRQHMNSIHMHGRIVIGEGEMDEAPMLYIGEELGTGTGPRVDIAVDPVEGTSLMAKGQDNAIAVIAVSREYGMLNAPDMYMNKIAVGPKAKGAIDIEASLTENMNAVAKAMGKDIKELTVMIQERSRHDHLVDQVLAAGARVKLFSDGDVTGVIATALDDMEVDILVGTGGAPEGVIAAAALKCLGGDFQAKLVPQNLEERARCIAMGMENPEKVLVLDDIIRTDDCFFVATGITDGMLLRGVRKAGEAMTTHSFIATAGKYKSKTYQFIESRH